MLIAPRPIGQVIAGATNTLARVWRPLVGTALMVFVPIGLVTLVVFQVTGAATFLDLVFNDPEHLAALSTAEFLDEARPFIQATLVAFALQTLGTLYVYAAMAHLVSMDVSGYAASGSAARRHATRRFLTLFVAGLIAALVLAVVAGIGIFFWSIPAALVGTPNATSVLLALVLFGAMAAPGIWLGVSMSMFVPIVIVEPVGPFGALRRSFRLVRGRWWATFGFLVLVGLLGFVAVQLIQLVAIPLALLGDLGSGISIVSALGVVAQGVIIAGYGTMFASWYVDLRARTETLSAEDLS